MTIEEALAFLASHQRMPANSTQPEVDQLDDVRRYLALHPDARALPLVLGLFADHMGWGIFQLFDDVLAHYPSVELSRHLQLALASHDRGTRWWAAHWAVNFPSRELVPKLVELLAQPDDEDAHYFAIASLGEICKSEFNPAVLEVLRSRLRLDMDPERRQLLVELLAELDADRPSSAN
jgi:hypothetical protein